MNYWRIIIEADFLFAAGGGTAGATGQSGKKEEEEVQVEQHHVDCVCAVYPGVCYRVRCRLNNIMLTVSQTGC